MYPKEMRAAAPLDNGARKLDIYNRDNISSNKYSGQIITRIQACHSAPESTKYNEAAKCYASMRSDVNLKIVYWSKSLGYLPKYEQMDTIAPLNSSLYLSDPSIQLP